MGVYIKGMSKPKNCRGCYFNGSNLSCLITRGRIDRDDYTCEIECPIVEVKTPHGRLIDADKLKASMSHYDLHGASGWYVSKTPTVIEEED